MTDNAIVHFDISGPDENGVRAFYAELLGWKVDPQGPGYALVDTPGGLRGSLIEAEAAQVTTPQLQDNFLGRFQVAQLAAIGCPVAIAIGLTLTQAAPEKPTVHKQESDQPDQGDGRLLRR